MVEQAKAAKVEAETRAAHAMVVRQQAAEVSRMQAQKVRLSDEKDRLRKEIPYVAFYNTSLLVDAMRRESIGRSTVACRRSGTHSPKSDTSRITATVWNRSMSAIVPAVFSHSRPAAAELSRQLHTIGNRHGGRRGTSSCCPHRRLLRLLIPAAKHAA